MRRSDLHFGRTSGVLRLTTVVTILVAPLLSSLVLGQNKYAEKQVQNQAGDLESLQDLSEASTQPADQVEVSQKPLRGQIVVAPIPISSPALGTGIVPVVGYIFHLSKHDTVSPPSVLGGVGLITDNGSRACAAAGQLFMGQDTYRITAAFFQGNLNYNFYGIGIDPGNGGFKLPLKQDGSVFLGQFLRQLKWKIFVGPRVLTGHSEITTRPGGSTTVPNPPDLGLRTSLTSIGFRVERDTRANRFYPTNGTVFELTGDFFANAFGSKYSFQSYSAVFNSYWSLSPKQVLAYNAYFCGTGGRPPFYGNCIYGMNNELRGYEAGRYLDPYMVATQLEYRLAWPWRFGVVAFAGIGGMADSGQNLLRSHALLPAGGAGLRFMLSRSYHVNLRADFAAGKNEHTFGMGVSEAF